MNQHIIANPHNGATVEHDGLTLEPGFEVLVNERDAHELQARFGFLLHRVADKTTLKYRKPKALAGNLNWEAANHGTDEVPQADSVTHVIGSAKRARTSKPRAPRKSAKKAAK